MKVYSNMYGDVIWGFSDEDKKEVNSIINSQKELYEKVIELNNWYNNELKEANEVSMKAESGYNRKILRKVFGGIRYF